LIFSDKHKKNKFVKRQRKKMKKKNIIMLLFINFILTSLILYFYFQNKDFVRYYIRPFELYPLNGLNNERISLEYGKQESLEKKETTLLGSEGVSYLPQEDRFNIYLIWFGDKFPDIYLKGLETIVYHHPNADVLLFSNELNESLTEPFKQSGYNNVHIVRFNMTKMVENKPGFDFVQKADKLLRGEKLGNLLVTRVHLSDFLRYFLVYNYGGFYIDTDSFVMKNMQHLKNTIGVTDNFSYHCSSKVFSAPKAKNFTCLSNSVYHFDKHHSFMKDALENYDLWWIRHQGYAPAGAIMLMDLIEKNFDKINFLPQREILCFYHLGKAKKLVEENDPSLKEALDICYTIQLLGAGSATSSVSDFNRSFVGRIYNRFKIL
jgi:hypothetical protein